MEFFAGKTMLITGATGFLAKILVEKLLRLQPNVRKLYVLVRAKDLESAKQRFNKEAIETELFRVLKEKIGGKNLSALVEEKVFPIPGDISLVDMGIEESDLKEQILNEVDIIVNSAANTTFDERYDVAMRINAFGPLNVLNFSKKCSKLKLLVHVSTAYVCGDETFIEEKEFHLGETISENSYLDIELEKKIIEKKLKLLEAQNPTEKQVKIAMKELGLERSKVHGWRNTYSMTKAMGEMHLLAYKENLPLVIIRPTTITSTYKEPFPGWIEGARTVDIFVVMFGKGKSNFMLGDGNSLLDAIPGDMVVNAILAAILRHTSLDPPQEFIYHVGSSRTNPLKLVDIMNWLYIYFSENPWTDKNGNLVKVRRCVALASTESLHRYITIYYLPILQVLKLANKVLYNYFEETCTAIEKNINFVYRVSDLYRPYLFYYGIFDDANIKMLMKTTAETNTSDILFLDVDVINWENYILNTHFPGVVKYAF